MASQGANVAKCQSYRHGLREACPKMFTSRFKANERTTKRVFRLRISRQVDHNDNNVTTLASNALSLFLTHNVKRYSQAEKKHVCVEQPRLINSYNENMDGVDCSDQNIGQYRVSIRGKKWYFPLIRHCIDTAMQNV
ncbi:hypothetical protein ILUMI_27307 [Ignelater luminosus]|uniref:PiggyBac transposable element-derived protein domain-containing protein n=1 Tax=Ignelater luminosus TaxID=2038154 RepID=A0A8K0FYA7_IGNLU|nr:hypothetical protein ILUMI_27307 [Ignelater luminosus]